jgi:glutamate dehydrogenase/leucine dehydrogenase
MWKRYNAFLRRPPELTVAWRDPATGARGWLVFNSLRGNAAGGGTRMRIGANPRETTYLAKTMELKFALVGPQIGGAKSALDFDPCDPRKADVLERWYRHIRPYLRDHYGTGGDLNVDEVTEVIPTLARLGVAHPQEGIARGHFGAGDGVFQRIIHNLDVGVKAPLTAPYGCRVPRTIADMVTGYGLSVAINRFYEREGRSIAGARVLLEGFGNVGAGCALYLARAGARIVGIADAEKVLVEPAGLAAADIEALIQRSPGRMLPGDDPRLLRGGERTRFLDVPADVFVAAAISGSIDEVKLQRLAAAGVGVIAGGANHPFREARMGSTRVAQAADRSFSVIPDVVANCGMARTFSYLMEDGASPTPAAVYEAVRRTVSTTVDEVCDRAAGPTQILAATCDLALDRVGAP